MTEKLNVRHLVLDLVPKRLTIAMNVSAKMTKIFEFSIHFVTQISDKNNCDNFRLFGAQKDVGLFGARVWSSKGRAQLK